ncbi:hypothetical protein MW887_000828 [Aspergillus wentii]|nr:hypothetical protein MW887_000828 [Aspergillus wentii]
MVKQQLPYQGSVQEHINLLHTSQKVLEHLIKDSRIQNAASPTLIHPDLHKRNIYVNPNDPTIITGIIDWQSTTEKQKLNDAKICHQTYDVIMKGLIPKMGPAKLLDPTLFRPFHYCHTTWRDSATALRQELMELSARLSELGMEESCPYSPGEEEITEHAQYYEDFETVQRLKLWLKNSLNTDSDGWVPNEFWDAAKDAHKTAYHEWMETAREAEAQGDELTVEKADRLWPFDSR